MNQTLFLYNIGCFNAFVKSRSEWSFITIMIEVYQNRTTLKPIKMQGFFALIVKLEWQ